MSNEYRVRAPKSMQLRRMSPEQVAEYISERADKALDALGEFRPVAVNRVVVDELVPGDAADPGVWAEWTRACCSHRDRIEEFVDPIVDFLDPSGSTLLRQIGEQHVESQMRVVELQNPTMHKNG